MGMFTGTIKYKGLSVERLMNAFEETGISVLNEAQMDAKRLLKQVVGKRYASLSQLAKAGHPYARRHGNITYKATLNNRIQSKSFGSMPAPPGFINKQTGRFASSFVFEAPKKKHNALIVEIQSNAGELDNILKSGTPTMVNRPWDTLFNALLRDNVTNHMRNEYRKALHIRLVLSR